MWAKSVALAAMSILAVGMISTAGVAGADPDDQGSQLCPYPDVSNPNCTQFPDDHTNEGDLGNHHDEGHR